MTLRHTVRIFRRHRLYTVAFAGTLALAVAAATASLAVAKRAFLDALPYRDGDRLISLLTVDPTGHATPVSPHVLADLEAARPPLEGLVSIRPWSWTLAAGGSAEELFGVVVTPSFFTTLGAVPALGRPLHADDRDAVVVSHELWQRVMGGRPDAVGRSINLGGTPRTVVGVMPAGYLVPYFANASYWAPLHLGALVANDPRARRSLTVVARRTPQATAEQVDTFLDAFSRRMQQDYPEIHGQQRLVARPLRAELVGAARPALLGVAAAAILLVLIVGANVAGLAAARALGRRQQVAVRAALGASRGRLLGEALGENLLLAAVGSGAGIWLGGVLIGLVARYQSQFLGRMAPVTLDWLAALIGMIVGLACGATAALISSAGAGRSADLVRGSRSAMEIGGSAGLRSALVVVQVALALVLIAGAGLLVRTVAHLASTGLGFSADRVRTVFLNLSDPKYANTESQLQFERDVLARLERIPGVVGATASVGFPVVGSMGAGLAIQGQPADQGMSEIHYFSIAPDFLGTLGITILAGRGIEETDGPGSPPVVVINETMARTHWPAGGAVGAQVRIGPSNQGPWITVVGVVADVRQWGPLEAVLPTAFGSTHQFSWPRRYFAVRTAADLPTLATDIGRAIRAVDPAVALAQIRTVDEMVANQMGRHRLVLITLAFFGAVATVLSGLGLYAVVALSSELRRHEYAVRIALGAELPRVRWMVLRQALGLALGGAIAGLALAAAGTRVLQSLLHGVTAMDAAAVGVAVAAVLALALASAWAPARRAGRVDPVEVLKGE